MFRLPNHPFALGQQPGRESGLGRGAAIGHPVIRGVTLLEMMVVASLFALVAILAGPPMADFIGKQRLRGTASQLLTDLNYARSEAQSRNQFVGVLFRNVPTEPQSCYVIFASATLPGEINALDPSQCNCTQALGNACGSSMREVRTVQISRGQGLQLRMHDQQPRWFVFDPVTTGMRSRPAGALEENVVEFCVETTRETGGRARVAINSAGHSSLCSPDRSVGGLPACTYRQDTTPPLLTCLPL